MGTVGNHLVAGGVDAASGPGQSGGRLAPLPFQHPALREMTTVALDLGPTQCLFPGRGAPEDPTPLPVAGTPRAAGEGRKEPPPTDRWRPGSWCQGLCPSCLHCQVAGALPAPQPHPQPAPFLGGLAGAAPTLAWGAPGAPCTPTRLGSSQGPIHENMLAGKWGSGFGPEMGQNERFSAEKRKRRASLSQRESGASCQLGARPQSRRGAGGHSPPAQPPMSTWDPEHAVTPADQLRVALLQDQPPGGTRLEGP